jgi:DNA-binding transcriptional MerR regulator
MLRIGAFAERASVSVKTLRFYDRIGLFRPMLVDPKSGYRYYELDQLEALHELRWLRELGCTVSDLKRWAAMRHDVEQRVTALCGLHKRLQAFICRDRARLTHVQQWMLDLSLASKHLQLTPPTVRRIAAIPVLAIRDRVRAISPSVYRMFEAAEHAAARYAARAPAEPFLLLHDGYSRRRNADVEVCVPVFRSAVGAVGGHMVDAIPRAVCSFFSGSYEKGPAAASAIETWMRVTGSQAAGPLRESYIRFGADQRGYRLPARFLANSEADFKTELQLPVQPRVDMMLP